MAANAKRVHRLKVTLREVKPPVWRRIEVPSSIKLSELAPVLEAAMGWLGGHLHSFEIAGVRYETPDDDDFGFPIAEDERKVRLREVLPVVKSKMQWSYDFGDGWKHDVWVEAIEARRNDVVYPVCIDGKRACPPEDCGGPWGYGDLLAALGDPAHDDHEQMTEWAPPGFDAEGFDADEATETMRSPRPLAGW